MVLAETVLLSRSEAEMLHRRITARDKAQSRDLQRMYEYEGWKTLGYDSWDAYLREAFDYSVSYLSRLNTQVQINQQLNANLPERQTRALKQLDSPEQRQQAYTVAKELAHAEASSISLRHVQMGVERVQARQRVMDSRHRVVQVMLSSDELSVLDANRMIEALDGLDAICYGKLVTILTEHGLRDPALIAPFADMIQRDSVTLQRILTTGTINEVPIRDAGLADLDAEKRVTQSEIISDKLEQQRQDAEAKGEVAVIPHIITVYENAPLKTLKALREVLPAANLVQLKQLL